MKTNDSFMGLIVGVTAITFEGCTTAGLTVDDAPSVVELFEFSSDLSGVFSIGLQKYITVLFFVKSRNSKIQNHCQNEFTILM